MNRKVIFIFLILPIVGLAPLSLAGQDKPNIILFLIDDADKYQFGCFGGPVYTPNIDQLAAEGLMFHQAYVNSTVCTPSRYSLTTGRYAGRSTYASYLELYPIGSQGQPEFKVGLEHDYMNIGHLLQTAGYRTGWVGKFHLHADSTLEGGISKKEEDYLDDEASTDDPLATQLFQQREKAFREYIVNKGFSWAKNIYEGNLAKPFTAHNLEWSIEAALDFIDSSAASPFYLHLNTTLLHGPDGEWERSMNYPNYTGAGLIDRELNADMPPRSTIKERIEANGFNLNDNPVGITWLDDGVGAIMKKLDSLGIADNTIFVFLPDHGSSNKASLFNVNGTNVPLIIRYPEKIAAGTESSSLVQAIDLIPTFYEYAGVEVPQEYQIDGKSLVPVFSDPDFKLHESLYFELGCARAVMTEDYKYIAKRYTQDRINQILGLSENELKSKLLRKIIYLDGHVGISSRGIRYNPEYLSPDQLYDMNSDYDEQHNLALNQDYQLKLEEMQELLKSHLNTFEDRPYGEFIPGPNATSPDSSVLKYIRNLQEGLRNGTISLDKANIICEGNCLLEEKEEEEEEEEEEEPTGMSEKKIRIFNNGNYIQFSPMYEIDRMNIYDIWGRKVSSHTFENNETFLLDKHQISPGAYIITLHSRSNTIIGVEKVIIN